MLRLIAIVWLALGLCGCSYVPSSPSYREFYEHLNKSYPGHDTPQLCSPYFIVFLVDARHLDYTDTRSFFLTVAKHPSDGSKNGDVGHAWIYLQGELDGQTVFIEGGHTGETGICQSRYFDGIMNYLDFGYSNPTQEQIEHPQFEPNPVKYLWETQKNGYFQWGAGNHFPSYAVLLELSKERFERILSFIQNYNYDEYALTGGQCSSFMAQAASLAGLDLECETTMCVAPEVLIGGRYLRLWEDPCYSQITIATPDVLEKSMMEAVAKGKAINAMEWYSNTHTFPIKLDDFRFFPKRFLRYYSL